VDLQRVVADWTIDDDAVNDAARDDVAAQHWQREVDIMPNPVPFSGQPVTDDRPGLPGRKEHVVLRSGTDGVRRLGSDVQKPHRPPSMVSS
jgi:hypothetical protein